MKKAILEFWVGLFVLLGFAALGILAFRVANLIGKFVSNFMKKDSQSTPAEPNTK